MRIKIKAFKHCLVQATYSEKPLLSPLLNNTYMNETYTHNPTNNVTMNVSTELTPYQNTFILHPNFTLYP